MIVIEEQSQFDSFESLTYLLYRLWRKPSEALTTMSDEVYNTYCGDYVFCDTCGRSLNRCAEECCMDKEWSDDYLDRVDVDALYEEERERKLMEK